MTPQFPLGSSPRGDGGLEDDPARINVCSYTQAHSTHTTSSPLKSIHPVSSTHRLTFPIQTLYGPPPPPPPPYSPLPLLLLSSTTPPSLLPFLRPPPFLFPPSTPPPTSSSYSSSCFCSSVRN
ncbi:hypothetical protein E2C01_015262 [Portunus trituberculatus]|uniref:Uncharacterized protein n=1 Tax=Portunus trituberculatus TaxID=210409 RepID=A0A5B7DKW5_PORTR|nr:hypothetical protein [Portunus trituberculatus]